MNLSALGLSTTVLCAVMAAATPVFAQSTEFTYQGSLKLSGQAVNGTADFQFRLFTSPGGSTQVGGTQNVSNMPVTGGVFTVPLNFGAGVFDGDERYLEIAVRSPANTGNFVILSPRQKLTATPYALKVLGVDGHSLDAADGSPGDALFVTNNGDVGIGTTGPVGKFEIRSGNNSYLRVDSANGDLHMNGGTDTVAGIYNDSTGANARMDFIVNNAAHMVVAGDGRIGMGTTNLVPNRHLTTRTGEIFTGRFESTHPIGSVIELHNAPTNMTWEWGVAGPGIGFGLQPGSMYLYPGGDPFGPPFVIAPNHWVGLGSTNPAFRLELPNIGNNDGRARANQWVTFSSKRWKENVETLDGALDTVKQLRGVEFDWKKEHGGTHDIGFVAEEVGQIVPELVTWEKDGQFAQGLAYDRITALAVEAIKEQQTQIEDQQRAIEDLKQANAELREQIADVMRLMPAINAEPASK